MLEKKKMDGLDKQKLINGKTSEFMKKVQSQDQQIGTAFDSGIFSTQILVTKNIKKSTETSTISNFDHTYKKKIIKVRIFKN